VADNEDSSSGAGQGSAAPPESEASAAAPAAQPENRRARRAAASAGGKKKAARVRERPGSDAFGGLDASERVDDAFSRASDRSFKWIKDHFNVVQWLIVGGIATWIGMQIYTWRTDRTASRVANDLASAVAAESGRIGATDEQDKRDERGSLDARRVFATDEARLAAAKDGFQKVVDARSGTPAGNVAKMGLAGVLFDQGKFDDAKNLYEAVLSSDLAKLSPEMKGRSLEGLGLSLEGKGDLDGALKKFGELENAEISGFTEIALYQEGRVLHEKKDDAAAVEKLKKALDRLSKEKTGPTDPPSYLLETTRSLLERIDPKAVPPPSQDEALRKALEGFQKKLPPGVSRVPVAPPAP